MRSIAQLQLVSVRTRSSILWLAAGRRPIPDHQLRVGRFGFSLETTHQDQPDSQKGLLEDHPGGYWQVVASAAA